MAIPGRIAELAIRTIRIQLQLQLQPSRYYADKAPINICLVHALEEHPPAKAQAVEWFLLTTMNVGLAAEAEQCLRWAIGINLVIA